MHNSNRLSFVIRVAVALVMLVTLTACSSKEAWYQQGKGQAAYDQDAQECRLIASAFARQATVSGDAEDPATYARTMSSCLEHKGWSKTPPPSATAEAGTAAAKKEPVSLATIAEGEVRAFGAQVKLPDQFLLFQATEGGSGPAAMQGFSFSGPQGTVINILVQRAVAKGNRFEALPYPVQPPFFLYEQGKQGTIFCGKIKDEWVMGLGNYFLINGKERITVIVTKGLMAPVTEAKAGFRLSAEQFAQVEEFKQEWLRWLVDEVTLPSRPWWSLLSLPKI